MYSEKSFVRQKQECIVVNDTFTKNALSAYPPTTIPESEPFLPHDIVYRHGSINASPEKAMHSMNMYHCFTEGF